MRKIYTLVLIVTFLQTAYSQAPEIAWEKEWWAQQTVLALETVVDADGNVLLAGTFASTLDFDLGPGDATYTANGSSNAYLLKLDPQGNYLWSIVYAQEGYFMKILFADNGDILVGGMFKNTVDFDPGAGIYEMTSNGLYDCFAARYTYSGEFIWAKAWGGTVNDATYAMDLDEDGNIYLGGQYANNVDFDPGIGEHVLSVEVNLDHGYILKLDSDGNFQWVESLISNDASVEGLHFTAGGNLYIAGQFSEDVTFDPDGSMTSFETGVYSIFIAQYDASGNFLWAKVIPTNSFTGLNGSDLDEDGNIYLAGGFVSTIDFDPGDGVFELVDETSSGDGFLVKYNPDGELEGGVSVGAPSTSQGFTSIFVDSSDRIYMTGAFGGTVDFDPGAGNFELTGNNADLFILTLATNFEFQWAFSDGMNQSDVAWAAASHTDGTVVMASSRKPGGDDPHQFGVLTKFEAPPANISSSVPASFVTLSPNPTHDKINITSNDYITNVRIFNFSGQLISSSMHFSKNISIETKALPAGIYFVEAECGSKMQRVKVIKE